MKEEYSEEVIQLRLSAISRAIGHPSRISVLLAIAGKGGELRGEIVSVEGMAQGTVVQHLRDLKKAGLIGGKIFGTQSHYWLNRDEFVDFAEMVSQLRDRLKEEGAS